MRSTNILSLRNIQISTANNLGHVDKKHRISKFGITVTAVFLSLFIMIQAMIIDGNRDDIDHSNKLISKLRIENNILQNQLNDISNEASILQTNLKRIATKNAKLSNSIEEYRVNLENTPLPKDCVDFVAETRNINSKAIELWKR